MSATIPNTMLMSDILKSTGFDCPNVLIGKTFAEATGVNLNITSKSLDASLAVEEDNDNIVIVKTE